VIAFFAHQIQTKGEALVGFFLIGVSFLLILLTFGLRIILIMSYSSYDELIQKIDHLLVSQKSTERVLANFLQAFVAHRLIIGMVAVALLLISVIVE
jgi:hypothetical protein